MNIIVKKNILLYKNYKLKCCIGKSGTTKSKKEGDLATPKGLYSLGPLYYRKDRIKKINCRIPKIIIKKKMGWCADSNSKNYNTQINFPYKYSAEKLYRKNKIYDIFLNIRYNQKKIIKKKGSAIFLHLTNGKYRPTKGCIALKKKDFLKILPHINLKTKILIV